MAGRVYLHVGTMKSATSYLQSLCSRNQQALADAGVLWLPVRAQFASTNALARKRTGWPSKPEAWQQVVTQIRDHPGAVLLSNELLAPHQPRRIKRIVTALRPAEVQVVITARDLGRVVPSDWQSTLRNQGQVPWPTFAKWVCTDQLPAEGRDEADAFWRRHDLAAIVQAWSDEVGIDAVRLVTVQPRNQPVDLIGIRFASVFGVDAAGFTQPRVGKPSLGATSAELLRRLNAQTEKLGFAEYKRVIRLGLINHGLVDPEAREPRFGLTPEQAGWVRERGLRMIDEVKNLGVSVVGDLDDLIPSGEAEPGVVDPTGATDKELLDAAMGSLIRLAHAVARDRHDD